MRRAIVYSQGAKRELSRRRADATEGLEPDVLEGIGRVVLVVDQSAKVIQQAIIPAVDELVPSRQIATPAASDEQFVVDLSAGSNGTFSGWFTNVVVPEGGPVHEICREFPNSRGGGRRRLSVGKI